MESARGSKAIHGHPIQARNFMLFPSSEWLPSGNLTVCYWKWPFIVDFPIDSMVIFYSYVMLVYQRVQYITNYVQIFDSLKATIRPSVQRPLQNVARKQVPCARQSRRRPSKGSKDVFCFPIVLVLNRKNWGICGFGIFHRLCWLFWSTLQNRGPFWESLMHQTMNSTMENPWVMSK